MAQRSMRAALARLGFGASLIALTTAFTGTALAQQTPPAEPETDVVVVTGFRGSLAAAAATNVSGQGTTPFVGYLNGYLRAEYPSAKAWDVGGDDRIRAESRQGFAVAGQAGSVDFRKAGADVTNNYLLNRFRLHVGYAAPWWSVYVEGQSSAAFGDDRFAYANNPAIPGTARRQGDGPEDRKSVV